MTYTEILEYLKSLAEADPQVNTVTRGEVSKLDLDKQNIYPLVHIDLASGTFNSARTITYEVYIAALQGRDMNNEVITDKYWGQDNEVDNHNETMIIVQKIWGQIFREWQNNLLGSDATPSFEKITYAKGNILDGWALTFNIEVPFDIDLC